jgi:serine/threonine-protein kinase ULK4
MSDATGAAGAASQPGANGRSLNDYHIYEEIGKGKQSIVYKGRRKKSIEYVAIKSVEKSQRDRLMNEV